MQQLAADTDPESEVVQLDLLRRATVQQRLVLSLAASEVVIALARQAARQGSPGMGDEEADLRFLSVQYGFELADEVRRELARRRATRE